MTGKTEQELSEEELDKYRRDGILVSTLKKLRANRSSLIVSSSTKLCGACEKEKDKLGKIEPIASISAIAYLMTMIPGVNMNMSTLKGLLFNPTYAKKIRRIDRIAIRMIQASEEYMMPFSRRATLSHNLDIKILQAATQLGEKPEKVAKKFERGILDAKSTTHIVADAIDSFVISKSEKKIYNLEKTIRTLKNQK